MGAVGTKESTVAAAEGKARNGSAPAVTRLARKTRTERERKETRVNSSTDQLGVRVATAREGGDVVGPEVNESSTQGMG